MLIICGKFANRLLARYRCVKRSPIFCVAVQIEAAPTAVLPIFVSDYKQQFFFIRFSFVQIIKFNKKKHTLIELRSSRLNFLNSSTRYNNWSDVSSFQPPNAMPSRVGAASRSFSNTQSTFLIFQLLKFRSLLPRNRCSISHFRLSSVRWRSRGGHAERSTWRQRDGEMATWRQREQTRLRRDNVGRVLVSDMV